MKDAALEVEGLCKVFVSRTWNGTLRAVLKHLPGFSRMFPEPPQQERVVLRDISFSLKEGEIIVLMGVSGAGKTTLLNVITGMLPATAGIVRVGGMVVNDLPSHKRNIAYITQSEFGIVGGIRVRTNIHLGARKRKLRESTAGLFGLTIEQKRQCREWVEEAAREAHLDLNLLDRLPGSLSGGELQRVQLARAFAERPSVVVADEPLSNLDQELKDRLLPEMLEFFRAHRMAVVYVTHYKDEARAIRAAGGRILELKNGTLSERADL